MARVATIIAFQFIILAFFALGEDQDFARTLDQYELLQGHLKKQKLTHFRVYWHDTYTGPNPTAMNIVRPPSNTSATHFGSLYMIDDPLTQGPELSSKLVGRAQGFYGSASQQEFSLLMAMNLVFLEGKYNGSTITILGRDEIFLKTREMPIIGGTGIFRFARGYVQVKTIKVDLSTADGVAEYNVYVLHY